MGLGGREEVCPARTKWEALEACRQIRGALEAFLGVVVWSRVLEVVRVRRSSRDRRESSRYQRHKRAEAEDREAYYPK